MSQKPNPGAVPKGDVSYLRATSAQGSQLPMAPSPVPSRDGNQTPVMAQQQLNNDWDDREELRQRELEEIRARAAQMEKTMRWWSDCTANWREKWSKVRNERNKAREENRQLRAKLDACIKENNTLKREKDELMIQNEQLKESKGDKTKSSKSETTTSLSTDSNLISASVMESDNQYETKLANMQISSDESSIQIVTTDVKATDKCIMQSQIEAAKIKTGFAGLEESEGSLAEERLALIELKLDESQKTISVERDEKATLTKTLAEAQLELNSVRTKLEESKQARQEALLEVERLRDQHKEELKRLNTDLEDESTSRSSIDRKLAELRKELERLQKENADEWGKRERLETERFTLERENKKLRSQIQDLEEQLERKSHHATAVVNTDMKSLQTELSEKNKELSELRHTHSKLKKTLQDRVTELEHCKRRAEQYEIEVKKLRSRVEELKRDLASAEDEVDKESNNSRKVQRSNDELQDQVENLTLQLQHLQSRLRRGSQTTKSVLTTSSSYNQDPASSFVDVEDSDEDLSEHT